MNQEEIRSRLESELGMLRNTGATMRRENDREGGRELTNTPTHPADEAAINEIEQSVVALSTDQEDREGQIVAALQRLDEGTYGTCVTCGQPIGEERLFARPDTDRCLQCQQQSETSDRYDETARRAR